MYNVNTHGEDRARNGGCISEHVVIFVFTFTDKEEWWFCDENDASNEHEDDQSAVKAARFSKPDVGHDHHEDGRTT